MPVLDGHKATRHFLPSLSPAGFTRDVPKAFIGISQTDPQGNNLGAGSIAESCIFPLALHGIIAGREVASPLTWPMQPGLSPQRIPGTRCSWECSRWTAAAFMCKAEGYPEPGSRTWHGVVDSEEDSFRRKGEDHTCDILQ